MKAATPYSIPTEPGRARAIALAAVVHVLLLAFLWIGVRWQNEAPVSVEAEIWSPEPRNAAARAPEPEPAPSVGVRSTPTITAQAKLSPKPKSEVVPDNKPDIALEQIKKRKAALIAKQVSEAAAEEDKQQKTVRKEAEQKRLDKERAQKARRDEQQLDKEQDRQRDQELAQQKKNDLKETEALKKRRQEEADSKRTEKNRAEQLRYIAGNVAGNGSSGDAPKSQGSRADSGYARKVAGIIRSNTVFNVPESLDGNPAVEYVVDLLPDGEVKGQPRKQKSSGVPGFDEAVLRAIEKSTFPPDKSGAVPPQIIVSHKPKD